MGWPIFPPLTKTRNTTFSSLHFLPLIDHFSVTYYIILKVISFQYIYIYINVMLMRSNLVVKGFSGQREEIRFESP